MTNGDLYYYWGMGQNVALVVMCQGFWALCYWLEHPAIEKYKALEEPWPWNSDDKETWNKLYWKTVCLYTFNIFILNPMLYAPFLLDPSLPVPMDCSMEGLPSAFKLCGQMLFCMLMEDLIFHCSHRFLHRPWVYPYIHKIHHEHKVTIGLAASHAHPVEYLLGNVGPTIAGPLILGDRMHFLGVFTWYILRTIEGIEGHSGYDFSWSAFRMLPFGSDFGYHAYHHSHNIGNYSSFFTIWDTVFGSNKAYYA